MSDQDKKAFEEWWEKLYDNHVQFRDWQGCDIAYDGKEDMRYGWQAACLYKQKKIDELNDLVFAIETNNKSMEEQIDSLEKELNEVELREISANRNFVELSHKYFKIQEQNKKLRECVEFYANTEIYRRPEKDRNGMGGMSSMTDFELDDGEWKLNELNEKDHYCYGKRARQVLKEIGE